MTELSAIPCWYQTLAVIVTLFHVVRGAIGQRYLNQAMTKLPESWQKVIVFYLHDALLHVVCTVSGFVSLLIAFKIAQTGLVLLSASASVLMVFLALVGLAGITGQLATVLLSGKLPWLKE